MWGSGLALFFSVVVGMGKSETEFTCQSPGKFASVDPTKYYECHLVGENKFTMFQQNCPQDSCFDVTAGSCNIDYCEQRQDTHPVSFQCTSPGKFPHFDSSRRDAFFKCIEIKGSLYVYEYQCLPAKPCFNPARQMCQLC